MQINKEPLEKSEIKLTIELTPDEFLPYQEKAAKRISESVDIAGFRKGQAPLDVVKQKVGEMAVMQEAAQLAVQKALPEAIKQEDLETVGEPAIEVVKLAPENPFIFSASLPLLPEVIVGDMSKVKVKKEEAKIEEEEIQAVIDNLREMRAKEVLAEREAKEDDKVEVDFNVFLNSVPVDGGQSQKYPLVIGKGQMIPGFEEQIIGMKAGEEKEFNLAFPEEYHNKQLAGKEAEFKIKLHAVYDRQLPELNADLAGEVGEYESVDALKDAIEKNLFEEKQQKAQNQHERELIEQLIDASKFGEIPEVMVNREAQQMMNELEQNISRQGLKFDDYLQHLKKDRGQLLLEFTPDAVKRIKSALLLRAVAKNEEIEPSEEEVKTEIDAQRETYKNVPQMLQHLDSPSYRDYVKTILRNKKTIEWLKEKAA